MFVLTLGDLIVLGFLIKYNWIQVDYLIKLQGGQSSRGNKID